MAKGKTPKKQVKDCNKTKDASSIKPKKASPKNLAKASPKKKLNFASNEISNELENSSSKPGTSGISKESEEESSRDNSFREFRRICSQIAAESAYTGKTAILKTFFTKGSEAGKFQGDSLLWCKMLLPGAVKRIYNLRSKQLIKLFARIFGRGEDEMLDHLDLGDVAETVRVFFEKSSSVKPSSRSRLSLAEVDGFLEELSQLTKEEEQTCHIGSIVGRCTANDLKMIVRLIKHDLRINAGPKHVLEAIHEDAYKAFQVSRDLDAVIERCLSVPEDPSTSASPSLSPKGSKVALALMTPVLPMLAEACKSVEMATRKCPSGMFAEVKYDGERVQIHKRGSDFRYFSRSLKPVLAHKVNHFKDYIPKAFPDGDDLILDTEILLIDNKTGKPLPFGTLGKHKKAEFKDANVCLFIFDCIYYNGDLLMEKPMKERRRILMDRITEIPNRIMLSETREIQDPKHLTEFIVKVLKLGLEGLVLKNVDGKYEPGKRHWLKVKKDYLCGGAMADSADLVVLGAWYGTGHKGGMMSVFLMGCYDTDKDIWLTVTKVHTGHDDATLKSLQDQLDMVKISKDPNLVPKWLRANKPMVPDFVARDPKKQPVWEITGAEFTNQGVHTADGISIRFPRVTRIRDDKDWKTATNLKELRILFQKSSESMDFSLFLRSNDGTQESSKTLLGSLKKFEDKKEIDDPGPSTSGLAVKEEIPEDDEDRKPSLEDLRSSLNKEGKSVPGKEDKWFGVKVKIEPKEIKNEGERKRKIDRAELKESKAKRKQNSVPKQEKDDVEMLVKKEPWHQEGEFSEGNNRSADFYAFLGSDYIEYSSAGSPLNWVEGRRPPKGLPPDAKPLSSRDDSELRSKTILNDVRVILSRDIRKSRRKELKRTLKTLGAMILRKEERSRATHVIHDCRKLPETYLRELEDIPKKARHVDASWVDATVRNSKAQDDANHAVTLFGVYCSCPCPHGR
ncbi:DNA ligase 3 isoform X2 [Orussus abietinus]|nr:DNA ligase 3 isoform X2 [Orussus abietinus]